MPFFFLLGELRGGIEGGIFLITTLALEEIPDNFWAEYNLFPHSHKEFLQITHIYTCTPKRQSDRKLMGKYSKEAVHEFQLTIRKYKLKTH